MIDYNADHLSYFGLQTWRMAICRAGEHKECGPDCPLYRFREHTDKNTLENWQKCESGVVIHRFWVEDVIKELEKTEPWKTRLDKIFKESFRRPIWENVGGELTF